LTRGVIAIENNTVKELRSTPRPFFVQTIEQDARGTLWYGAKARAEDSGLYQARDVMRPSRIGASLGIVTTIRAGAHDDLWVGTNRGLFIYDRVAFAWKPVQELAQTPVYTLAEDRNGRLLIGAGNGLYRSEKSSRANNNALRLKRIEASSTEANASDNVHA